MMNATAARSGDSLSHDVYQQLRQDIVHGVLRPNEALVESEIADRLGVSRTPVRESMQRLANDGLIVSKRRRWVVYEHSREEIAELYEIRAALEAHAARLAAVRLTDEGANQLREIRDLATGADLQGEARVEANEQFHDLVIRLAGNRRLESMIQNARLYHFNLRVAALYSTENLVESASQHGELIDALLDRDPDRAGTIARGHVEFALDLILGKLH